MVQELDQVATFEGYPQHTHSSLEYARRIYRREDSLASMKKQEGGIST
jgi:hypothetical protein